MKTAPSTVSTTPTYYPQATSAKRSVAVVPVPTTAQHSLVQKPEKPPNTSSKKPDNTMPMWVPVALMVSSIGLVGFVAWLASRRNDPHLPPKLGTEAEPLAEAIAETVVEESSKPTPEQKSRWFRNKKKKPVKATTPKQTAIATLESNEENASLHPTQVAEPNTKNPKAKQQPSKVKTLSLYARWCTFAFACSYFISSFLPARLSLPVVPVLTGQTESLASKIPPITKNPIYKLGFNCIENVLQVTKSAVKNPSSFPPVIPQTLEKFSTATACSETLPVLTTWGNNRPSSFLLATYKGNQFVGIQIPKKLTKDELDKLTLKQLSDKFMPEFNTLVWFTEKERNDYEKLSPAERKQQFETKYLPIAPRIDTSTIDLSLSTIPIETRYVPESVKPLVGKAFSLINASPEGRLLLEKAKKYNIALQYAPGMVTEKQNGFYYFDDNAVFLPAALLDAQNIYTPDDFNYLVYVLIHELGHGVIENERLIAEGKTRVPTQSTYDKNGYPIKQAVFVLKSSARNSHMDEMTVNTPAVTLATQAVGKLPIFKIGNTPPLKIDALIDTSIDFAEKYGIYSHKELPALAFLKETATNQEADTVFGDLGLGDYTFNRVLARKVVEKQRDLLYRTQPIQPKNPKP